MKRQQTNRALDSDGTNRAIKFVRSLKVDRPKAKNFSPNNCIGQLYLLYAAITNQYKIGISIRSTSRRKNVELVAGMEVELIDYWDVGVDASRTEQYVHAYFDQYRTIGEWFRFPDDFTEEDVRSKIEQLVNGYSD